MSFIPQKKIRRKFKKVIVITLGAYLLIGVSLYAFQEKMLFMPIELEQNYQFTFSYDFEELTIRTEDGASLNAIHFKVERPKGVILYFHGNMGNIQRWGTYTEFFVEKNYDVLVMDYRTFGKSKGKLSEGALYDDAQLFYDNLKKQYDESQITVYGRSLGTGIATWVASKNKPKQLLLETPFYSIADVAKHRFPIYPIETLLNYKLPSHQFIKDVKCPISIFHGTEDKVIPYRSGRKLFEETPKGGVIFTTIEGGNHNNLIIFEDYLKRVDSILE